MRPFRKIYIQPERINAIQITQSRTRSQPISRFKRLVIASMILVFVLTIVLTITSLKGNNKSNMVSATIILSNRSNNSLNTFFFVEFSETSTLSSTFRSSSSSTDEISINLTITTDITDMEIKTNETIARKVINTTTIGLSNLLHNPGAESQFDHWIQIGDAPVLTDFNGIFHQGYYPHNGNYCFAGGYTEKGIQTQLVQHVDLLNRSESLTENEIDSGELKVNISFYYRTWHDSNRSDDIIEVSMIFFTSSLNVLGKTRTGELICHTFNPEWCYYTNSFSLPIGTRWIYYIMQFSKNNQTDTSIDVYIDDNSLIII